MKRPLLYILIPFCLGIYASTIFEIPFVYSFFFSVLLIAFSFFFSLRRRPGVAPDAVSHLSLYLALIFLGMLFYRNSVSLPPGHVAAIVSDDAKSVRMQGIIVSDPVVKPGRFGGWAARFIISCSSIDTGGDTRDCRLACGLVDAHVASKSKRDFQYGDRVMLEGRISRPMGSRDPGVFDYTKYMAMQNIYAVLAVSDRGVIRVITDEPANPVKRFAYKARRALRAMIDTYLAGGDNSFIKAILIGDRNALGTEVNDEFIRTGTVHILSISGLHVALIAAIVFALLTVLRISRKISFILTAAVLVFYLYIAGASPPIVRCVIMFFVVAGGYLIERDVDVLNSLALAALLILLWNPKELFDPSFQLSFASIASLFIFTPKIEGLLRVERLGRGATAWQKLRRYISAGIAVSVAAWIGTWPIVASYFNIVSFVTIAANLVIVPLSSLALMVSIGIMCAGMVSDSVAHIAAYGLSLVDNILFYINHVFAQMPFGSVRTARPAAWFIVFYYALVLLWVAPARTFVFKKWRFGKATALILILFLFNICAWKEFLKPDENVLTVTFLDVGQGDAAFVEFPGGENLLIDAGPGGNDDKFDVGRAVVAPFLWNKGVRRIDTLLITHMHEDHLGGAVYLMKNFPVGTVADSGAVENTLLCKTYARVMRERGVRHITVGAGDKIRFACGAEIFFVSPERHAGVPTGNAGSVAAKLVYGKTRVLFCGDLAGEGLARAVEAYGTFLRSEILKVPHHGGNIGTGTAVKNFFDIVSPEVSIISAGRFRRYDMRKASTSGYLKSIIYNTINDGAVVMCVSENEYKINSFLK